MQHCLASIAAATADTWGTEIGTLSRSAPVLITTFKPVDRGSSGGISLLGLLAGIAGSVTIGLSGLGWISSPNVPMMFVAIVLGGMTGSLVDSFIGATIQVQYRCGVCGKFTERIAHCGRATERFRGRIWMKNDQVNAACTPVGAIVGIFVSQL